MTPSAAAAAARRPSRSARAPRGTSTPLALSPGAEGDERATPVRGCPALRSWSTTAEPMCPLAPVTKTCMGFRSLLSASDAIKSTSAVAECPRSIPYGAMQFRHHHSSLTVCKDLRLIGPLQLAHDRLDIAG